MRFHAFAVLLLLFFGLLALPAPAQDDSVVVATRDVPPFAMPTADGRWEGLAIDLWEEVAAQLGLASEYVDVDLAEMLSGVASGEVDVVAGALTVTAEREKEMDFSHPFLSSGLGIAVRTEGSGGLWHVFAQLASPAFLKVVLALGTLLLVCGALVWVFERRANPDEFGGGLRGVGAGFWWSAVTMTTVGYGDKSPRTLGGRVVGLVWMFASIIVISGFTAAIASSLTVGRLEGRIQGPDDLPGSRVGTVLDSTSAAWCAERNLRARGFASADEALESLAADELDAVVYDGPVLRYLLNSRRAGGLDVLPHQVLRQDYAFALPSGSELRERVNLVLLDLTASPAWERILERHLGE